MRSTPDALMLFAAGLGTRMRELTLHRPKPLLEVAGRPLLDHALDLARAAGVGRIVANAHYRADQILAHLAGTGVRVSDETDLLLETGGGLRKALPLLGPGPVFTLNTDAVWTGPNVLGALSRAWDGDRMSALLALVPREAALGYTGAGDFALAPDGRISRGTGYVYTGAQIIDPAGIETIPDPVFSLNLLWNRILSEGRAYGVVHPGGWCDVGRPECISLAEGLLSDAAR
ncbi:nucleotidyltransferase family protein [Rhodobacter capsulatus]|uniref:nucleotidyltransferase family protein n=1 Tax=Rhodobacter capsulatus TaxID=1061 RepID=UPI0006DC2CE9|nr:nucleotidyltransferase family protein [Rhodobacter capsulatus]KQB14623.1 nucleotidyltransferase [Rhodobacter capsulatus]KQB14922.1 nucleotidyltransferase [Rhodobacter capsulatus]PZX24988.1 MurNAc alpha-1-phosphate uridylyltransferase [Rhodobacter capsulatus]QNR63301.1 nucleotidyltransferase family protein [Rhodobacter capsulatus]